MLALEIDSLQAHLQEEGYTAHFQAATGQICVDLPLWDGIMPVFIRIYETGDLLQLALILPIQLQAETLSAVSRLLHLLNKEIDLPGFGLDEEKRVAFYRMTIPAFDGEIHPRLLSTLLLSIQSLSQQCIPPIAEVAAGNIELETLLKQFRAAQSPLAAKDST
jgi:hypothetical protein